MKPANLRPQALRDQESQTRYYRKGAGGRMAVRLVNASDAAPDQIDLAGAIGPNLGACRLARSTSEGGLGAYGSRRSANIDAWFSGPSVSNRLLASA